MLNNKEFIVILDNIRSVHNVGAIFRTCDGSGCKEIFLCGITPTPNHAKFQKTALNAQNYVKWSYFNSVIDAINLCKKNEFTIYSIEQSKNPQYINSLNLNNKAAFIFGNEITGVSSTALNLSNQILEIPMNGKKNSLNVSTCVGIVTYYYKMQNE